MGELSKDISVISVVLFIGAGALVFFLLFILAKRQIIRFAWKATRPPHVSIGLDAPKDLKEKILSQLERTALIRHEPLLLNPKVSETAKTVPNHYYYRMKAVDAFSKFDEVLKEEEPDSIGRHPSKNVRGYLFGLYTEYLSTSSEDLIHKFCDSYEHARHDPNDFGEDQYNNYMVLLEELITCLRVGLRKKRGMPLDKASKLETEVIFDSERKGIVKTKTNVHPDKTETKGKSGTRPGEIRYRSRTDSSVHSSLLDSGHSSQSSASIELTTSTRGGSTERDNKESLNKTDTFC
ncbi:protein C1orf43 homolog [Mytilus trossulus]|uniref:protein C1orf43 homolog n=1 Tax=Mytilus trossulus TaxID=6551 RepID=UPI003004B9A0